MSHAPTIQIAFQGGGAKLVAMLPVAAAFKKCHDDGTIRISAVSGASAGSICAALIASDANFSDVVSYLRNKGDESIAKIVPEDARKFARILNEGYWGKTKYAFQNIPFLYGVIFAGRPILDEKEFSKFIKGLFQSSRYKNVDDTKIKLYINASDIVQQENRYLSGLIHAAVTDSASIPIAFRSFRAMSRSHVVDGGLCQNLPSDILLKNPEHPIFAVFPEAIEEKNEVGNILQYCFALFSASITHNVQRSREQISKAFSIGTPCDYSTFDFEQAMNALKNEHWFSEQCSEYEAQIRDFARNYGTLHSRNHFRFSDIDTKAEYIAVVDKLTSDYLDYVKYNYTRFHVFVNCDRFLKEDDPKYHRPSDTVVKTARFTVTKQGFHYFRSYLGVDPRTNADRPSIWTARNLTKNCELEISVHALPKKSEVIPEGNACVVMFKDADNAISVGDEIEIVDSSYVRDGMIDMNRKRNEVITILNSHDIAVGRAELVITYPRKIGTYRLINIPGEQSLDDADVQPLVFKDKELKALSPELCMTGIYTDKFLPKKLFGGLAVRAV
ncbi:patatin-like phospholipase family protein [Rhizobium mongolense]|uniref:patatin-like phospholipase family protein n=1 Tax=Rhizobium mongolense TaxID=57676 RepID=UPI0034A0E3B8